MTDLREHIELCRTVNTETGLDVCTYIIIDLLLMTCSRNDELKDSLAQVTSDVGKADESVYVDDFEEVNIIFINVIFLFSYVYFACLFSG